MTKVSFVMYEQGDVSISRVPIGRSVDLTQVPNNISGGRDTDSSQHVTEHLADFATWKTLKLLLVPREDRMYPGTISEWNDFEGKVFNFIPSRTKTDLEPEWYEIFKNSVHLCSAARRDESGEQEHLLTNLVYTLTKSRLVFEMSTNCTAAGGV
jgi:hypothetical protein